MNILKKSGLCLSIALATPINTNASASSLVTRMKNMSSTEMALVAVGSISAAVVGALAYNAFFGLSDLEEIEQTLAKLEDTESEYSELLTAHYEPCTHYNRIDKSNPNISEHDNHALKAMIRTTSNKYPFYEYVQKTDTTCSHIKEMIDSVTKVKIRLFERRNNIIKDRKTYDEATKKDIIKKFNSTIEQCDHLQQDLRTLQKAITEVRNYIVRLQEYNIEYAAARIEALEREIKQLKLSWPRQCNCVHYHRVYVQPTSA